MRSYIIKKVKLGIYQREKPELICHQINDDEKLADLCAIEFESLEIYNITSLKSILFVTENNVRIDLSKYDQQAIKKDSKLILNLDKIEEFKAINIPNWFEIRSDLYTDLKGIINVNLRYLKPETKWHSIS